MKRKPDESFEDYKARRADINKTIKNYLKSRKFLHISKDYTWNPEKEAWVSEKGKTYHKEFV